MSAKRIARTSAPKAKHRTTPIAASITSVPGYPAKLTIYQLEASPFWWVRYYANGKIVRRSTKKEDKSKAFTFAKSFYEDIIIKQRQGLAITNRSSFEACAAAVMAEQAAQVERKAITKITADNAAYRLNRTVIPFFGKYDVTSVNYIVLGEFLAKLSEHQPKLSLSTIGAYMKLVRRVLLHAQRTSLLHQIPPFPRVGSDDNPRGYFDNNEYRLLWNRASSLVGKSFDIRKVPVRGGKEATRYVETGASEAGRLIRRVTMTDDLYQLIVFMVNSFIRPTDIKNIKHAHVEIVRKKNTYLRLRLPPSKKHKDPIVTMPMAVDVYERIVARHKAEGHDPLPTDYLFAGKQLSRDYALKEFQRQFDVLLEQTGLRHGVDGKERSLYSLRHSCIMFRLKSGEKIDLITLARNARTSPDMINRFYASQLKAEDGVDMLQSYRKK